MHASTVACYIIDGEPCTLVFLMACHADTMRRIENCRQEFAQQSASINAGLDGMSCCHAEQSSYT